VLLCGIASLAFAAHECSARAGRETDVRAVAPAETPSDPDDVRAGPAVVLEAVSVAGPPARTASALLRALETPALRGRSVDARAIERDAERILAFEERHGHPYAVVRPEVVAGMDGRTTILFHIEEGPLVTFDRPTVTGNTVTRAATVARIAGLPAGGPYAPAAVTEAAGRLMASRLFASVDVQAPLDSTARSIVPVRIHVVEPRYNAFQGAAAYLGKDHGLSGLLDLTLGNVAGRASSGRIRWQRQSGGATEYTLSYREPWVGPIPVGVAVGLDHLILDTLYTRTELTLAADVGLGARWKGSLGVDRVRGVTTTVGGGSSLASAVTASLAVDTAPDAFERTGGFMANADLVLGSRVDRAAGAETHRTHAIAGGIAEARVPLGGPKRFVVARLTGRGIVADASQTPAYELLYIGGARSVRGYRERQFAGTTIATASLEGRLLLDRQGSRVEVFVDAGYASDATLPAARPAYPLGYGLGLWTAARSGLLGIDYGIGRGAGVLDGQLHLTLLTLF
jgi:outer membrane protein assembly factor BamA